MSQSVVLTALGGSAENGRNCYMLKTPQGNILLDCGVKRVVTPEYVGEYPLLTREIVSQIKAVFLSHAHEDHCAALPLLYALGYDGHVYASGETIDAAPQMMEKWMKFVRGKGGSLPFSSEDAARVQFLPLELGKGELCGLRILAGRSGHTAGSMWIALGWQEKGWQMFYSGDMCTCAVSLACDMPPACGFAVLNCAYAGQVLVQDEQYDKLTRYAREAAGNGGRLLLPVPPTGRGCDMLLHLVSVLPEEVRVFAAKSVVKNTKMLLQSPKWLKNAMADAIALQRVTVLDRMEDYENACAVPGGIILVTDGMLTTAEGQRCFEMLRGDANNRVIISGHAAPGTLGGNSLSDLWREEQRIAMAADKLIIKVHLDDRDVIAMQQHLLADRTVFFHSPEACCESTFARYAEAGAKGCCLKPGESIEI